MNRLFAFFAALLVSTLAVSSACTAAQPIVMSFTLEPASRSDSVQAHFARNDRNNHHWSSDFRAAQLAGFNFAGFRAPGTRPLSFTLLREAGRVDCAGTGGNSLARGTCRVTPDAGFLDLLARRGIGHPSDEEALGLIALDVRRSLIEALAAARYPTPSIGDLIGLTALGADERYISGLARAGYRPATIKGLVEFKALNITPEFIADFVRLGYGNLPAGDLVQLKALGIDAAFVAGFDRLGYGRLPVDDLVQLKALGVTPQFVAEFQRMGYRRIPVSKLVEMKAVGVTPEFIRSMRGDDGRLPSPDELASGRRRGSR